jgi:hypothetical protein
MTRVARWLPLVYVWCALDAHSAEKIRTIEFKTEVVTVVIPDGYKIAHEQPGIIEMIPRGQKIKSWRDIFTIGTFPHVPEAPEAFRMRAQAGFVETCGGKHVIADNNIGTHRGSAATMWMQACEKHKSGPSKGKSELDVFLLVKGKEVDLLLMRGFRYSPSDRGEIGRWMDFLQKSTLRPK